MSLKNRISFSKSRSAILICTVAHTVGWLVNNRFSHTLLVKVKISILLEKNLEKCQPCSWFHLTGQLLIEHSHLSSLQRYWYNQETGNIRRDSAAMAEKGEHRRQKSYSSLQAVVDLLAQSQPLWAALCPVQVVLFTAPFPTFLPLEGTLTPHLPVPALISKGAPVLSGIRDGKSHLV